MEMLPVPVIKVAAAQPESGQRVAGGRIAPLGDVPELERCLWLRHPLKAVPKRGTREQEGR